MHKKAIIIILALGILTFGNSLFNGFVGDDEVLIVKNNFYKSWSNFPRLFTSDYITKSEDVFNVNNMYSHTGSVAYRPVLSTSFFFDHWIWEKNPFGYHLTNLILHLCNSVLVYFLVFFLFQGSGFALLSAIIFCIHPLKVEAICSVGYRADPLSCFFVLLAFLSYVRYRTHHAVRGVFGVHAVQQFRWVCFFLAHLFFAMAVFTKESAIVFPVLIIIFDRIYDKKETIKSLLPRHIGFILIALFYLYVYLYIFPNKTLDELRLLGGTVGAHVLTIFQIFILHLTAFLLPFSVKVLPPVYTPTPFNLWGYKIWFAGIALILLIYVFSRSFSKDKKNRFFALWFLISYIPISNIVPLPNPMAYRFMYLPSVGMAVVLALVINELCLYCERFKRHKSLSEIIKYGYIVICIGITISLTFVWKNNYTMASHMVEEFPDNPQGYLHLGMEQFSLGRIHEARMTLLQGLEMGLKDPRGYQFIGLTMFNDLKQSKPYYEKCVSIFPDYAPSIIALGRIYLFEGDLKKALFYLRKGSSLAPVYSAYGYLMQVYIMQNERGKAQAVLREAQENIVNESHLRSLSKLLNEKNLNSSIDIGL